MEDLRCPNGCGVLKQLKTPVGLIWECGSCKGRSMGVAVLKKSAAPKAVNVLWGLARDGHSTRGVPCLHCSQSSSRVSVSLQELAAKMEPGFYNKASDAPAIGEPEADAACLSVDLCQRCYVLWVETAQISQLPMSPKAPPMEEKELPDEAKKLMAIHMADLAAQTTARELEAADAQTMAGWARVHHHAGGLLEVLFWGLDF